MESKNVLIIGSGVLGAYLANFLIKNKYRIFVSSRKLKKNYLNYQKLNIQDKVTFKKLNISSKKEIKNIIRNIEPKYIYYFSGVSSITQSFKKPKETMISNYWGTKNFLEVIKENNFKLNFYKSNSGYIFNGGKNKITLNSKLIKANSPYAAAQIKSYKLINKFRKKNINCSNLVFFNVESPLRPDDYLIKKICKSIKLIKQKKIKTLKVGNINCKRDFSWAPEIMKAVFYFSKLKPGNILLGTGYSMSIKDILKILFRRNKLNYKDFVKQDKKLFRKNEQLEISCSIKDTKNLLKKFKWQPKIYGSKLLIKFYNEL